MKLSNKQKGIIALILLALIFASMGIFARYLKTNFTLFQQVYLRVGAAFLLGAFIFNKKINLNKFKKLPIREWIVLVFRALTLYLFGVSLFTYGILNAKYSNVSFISALPATAIFGFLLLGEKFNFKKLFYVLLAFFGVVLISVSDVNNIFNWSKGEFITMISVLFFSLSYISRKWHTKILNNYEISMAIFFISFLSIFLTSIFFGEGLPLSSWTPFLFIIVLGAGVFNLANLLLTNYGFARVEAVLAGNILSLESIFAVLIGFLFFNELPNLKELIGGTLILFSVIQMNKIE